MANDQIIDLTNGGCEYTYPLTITENTGKDISADVIVISLGSPTAPGTWQAPDVDPPQANKAQRVVQMLVGATLKPISGTYWLWTKVTDAPETVPRRQVPIVIT